MSAGNYANTLMFDIIGHSREKGITIYRQIDASGDIRSHLMDVDFWNLLNQLGYLRKISLRFGLNKALGPIKEF